MAKTTEELIQKNEEEISQQKKIIEQAQEKLKQLKKTGKKLLEKQEQEEQQSMLDLLKANNITKSKDLEKIIEERIMKKTKLISIFLAVLLSFSITANFCSFGFAPTVINAVDFSAALQSISASFKFATTGISVITFMFFSKAFMQNSA